MPPAPKPLEKIILQELTALHKEYPNHTEELNELVLAHIQAINKVLSSIPGQSYDTLRRLICKAVQKISIEHLPEDVREDIFVIRIMIGLDLYFKDAKIEPIDDSVF